jgi:two-component system, OmpR family, KDP operon response regulator KdpE
MARVLVIDDDTSLQRALKVALQLAGYEVLAATSGEQGISEAALARPDVVVLDLGLPDLDGIMVCRRIRQWSNVPIIVLSAADAELRKVAALDEGADDYVTKPFGMAELEARIRTALRHSASDKDEPPVELIVGPIRADLVHRQAELEGEQLKLTAREFDVLVFLLRYVGKVCTNQMILEAVWGSGYSKENGYLHAYIHRLREKLARSSLVSIDNSPGIGYVLRISSDGEQDRA